MGRAAVGAVVPGPHCRAGLKGLIFNSTLTCKPPSTRTLQAEELAEVVQGADTPLPVLLDAHDLVQTHDVRRAARLELAGGVLGAVHPCQSTLSECTRKFKYLRVLQNIRERPIIEPVCLLIALQASAQGSQLG